MHLQSSFQSSLRSSFQPFEIHRPSTVFSPDSIAGLQLWLDAKDTATIFANDNGSGAVSSGGTVGRWADKSGHARHFSQSSGSDRPIWNSAGYVEFAGGTPTGPHLLSGVAASNFFALRENTVFMVFDVMAASGNSHDLFSNGSNHGLRTSSASQVSWRWTDSASRDTAINVTRDTNYIFQARRFNNGDDIAISLNGGAETTNSAATGDLTALTGNLATPPAARNKAKCRLLAVLIWNVALTLAQRNAVGAYLADRYSLTWTPQT